MLRSAQLGAARPGMHAGFRTGFEQTVTGVRLSRPGGSLVVLRSGNGMPSSVSTTAPSPAREQRAGDAADAHQLLWCFDLVDAAAASPQAEPASADQPGSARADAGARASGPGAAHSQPNPCSVSHKQSPGTRTGASTSTAGCEPKRSTSLQSGSKTEAAGHGGGDAAEESAGPAAGSSAMTARRGPSDDAAATSLRGAMSMRRRAADQQRARSIRRAVRRAVQQQKTAAARMAATLAGVVGGRYHLDHFRTLFGSCVLCESRFGVHAEVQATAH